MKLRNILIFLVIVITLQIWSYFDVGAPKMLSNRIDNFLCLTNLIRYFNGVAELIYNNLFCFLSFVNICLANGTSGAKAILFSQINEYFSVSLSANPSFLVSLGNSKTNFLKIWFLFKLEFELIILSMITLEFLNWLVTSKKDSFLILFDWTIVPSKSKIYTSYFSFIDYSSQFFTTVLRISLDKFAIYSSW